MALVSFRQLDTEFIMASRNIYRVKGFPCGLSVQRSPRIAINDDLPSTPVLKHWKGSRPLPFTSLCRLTREFSGLPIFALDLLHRATRFHRNFFDFAERKLEICSQLSGEIQFDIDVLSRLISPCDKT